MKQVLWVSRHEMTPQQLADLERALGDSVELRPWPDTVRFAAENRRRRRRSPARRSAGGAAGHCRPKARVVGQLRPGSYRPDDPAARRAA